MRANFCFKAGEVICPASPNYTFENGEIVFNAESRVTLQKEFNATIINHFITATKEISKGELVTVSPSLIVYDATKITGDAAVTGFKNIGEEEKQQLFAYVDEKIRQQALADGFIPRCQPECVEVVRKSNFDLVTIVPRGSKAHTTLFTIAAVPLPFPHPRHD
uniref:Uncharacterized protein TCIL3000_9_3760 n=1 Tax=Trypanosoma congolense (strain IL3000) TaxID=1068625 RepID=G0UUB2_TRYCI|nr:unnamed protein product [Trypanosoma congolense IL3000]